MHKPGVVAHTLNPSTWVATGDGSLCVQAQLSLHSEFMRVM